MKISRHFFYVNIHNGEISKNFSPKFRGILGYGLKYQYCKNFYQICETCSFRDKCIFLTKFKPVEINKLKTVPFSIFSKKVKDKQYKIYFTVIDDHILLKEIIDSFEMWKHKGLGIKHLPYKITYLNSKIYELNNKWIEKILENFTSEYWKIKLLTPVITKGGFSSKLILSSIINRIKFLSDSFSKDILSIGKAEIEFLEQELIFKKQYKFSDIFENKVLNISGYKGEILAKLNKVSYLLLKVAEITHLGKYISFGCGKVKLEKVL